MILLNDLKRAADADRDVIEPALLRVAASGWFVLGNEVAGFERQFAAYVGVDHCIGVGNGTDALELSFRALGLGPGDGVVTVANAGMYTTLAARLAGCEPVFCDVDPATMLMDPEALAAIRGKDIRAVVVTHLFGRVAQMPALLGIARERGWAVIEDCAQAHGARRDGRMAGSFGDVATFSFYPTKNLGALGDGGAVTTNDGALAERLRRLRQYGWAGKYDVSLPGGRNTRLDEMQAAVLAARLPRLDAANARRREIARMYASLITRNDVHLPPQGGDDHVQHLYVVRTDDRDGLRDHLKAEGIVTDVHYPVPDHRQGILAQQFAANSLPVTERLAATILTLPCHPGMTDDEVTRVAGAVQGWSRA
jgi:aminotransferase EvaB